MWMRIFALGVSTALIALQSAVAQLVPLPDSRLDRTLFFDRATQIVQSCQIGTIAAHDSFIISGRGGIPASPTDTLNSSVEFDRWITLTSQSLTTPKNSLALQPKTPTPFVEAQRWVRSQNGTVALVAGAPVQRPTLPCR